MSRCLFSVIQSSVICCLLLITVTGCDRSRPSELRASGPSQAVSGESQEPIAVTILNAGSSPFHILTLESSCGCTIVDGDIPEQVSGRGEIQIPLKVSTSFPGKKQVNVTVTTDAEINPVQVVTFDVTGQRMAAPIATQKDYRFQVSVPSASDPATTAFSIRTFENEGTDNWLKGLTRTARDASITVQKTQERSIDSEFVERLYNVSFSVPDMEDFPDGKDFILTPELSCPPARDDVRVMVSVKVNPPLEALPARLTFSDGAESVSVQRLFIATLNQEEVALSEHETLPDGVSVLPVTTSQADSTPGSLFEVAVDWGVVARADSTAVLSFATPDGHRTTVPVRFTRTASP